MVVVLFGLDGASIDQIRSVTKRTKLPNFERLLSDGKTSNLLSVYPYVTAPAWTTMFSGLNPGKHGIFDMFEIDGSTITPSNMRKSDAAYLWDYLSWARKKVLTLGVPFIYPAPKINGIFVTGRFVPKLSTYPEDIGEKFDFRGYEYRELPTEQEIETRISQGTREMSLRMIEDLDLRIKTSLSLIDSDKWDAIILVDNLPDEVLHMNYEDTDIVDKMYSALDGLVGQLLQRLGAMDHLIVVSDHGFSSVKSILFMNEWLRSKKYLTFRQSLFSRVLNSFGLNWDRLTEPGVFSTLYRFSLKYFPGLLSFTKSQAASGFIVSDELKLASRASVFGINEPVAWIRLAKKSDFDSNKIIQELTELKEQKLLKGVFKSGDIFSGKYVDEAPGQLLIEANSEWAIDGSRLNGGKLVGKPLFTKKGVHQQAGIFGYVGKLSLKADMVYRIQDIAPTVLDLMRLPIPKNLDGTSLIADNNPVEQPWKLDISQRL